MKRVALVIIFLVFTSGELLAKGLDSLDYVLYSKVINSYLKEHKFKNGNKVLINGITGYRNTYSNYMEDPYKIPCLSCSTYNSENKSVEVDTAFVTLWVALDSVNRHQTEFGNKFKIKKYKPILIDSLVLSSYITNDTFDWNTLYKDYFRSVGIVTLSKIAYSDNRKYAILYLAYQYHGLGAVAKILYIDIEQDFKIVKDEIMWQS